ncbi:uncharacterized protein BDR25DRAFT_251022 [Lindgomyces ingoldianus]|uniref:Uncharacterized protein n=1 Tax=Lindgomyces ingoldianus TaxID=673940 RepID=A0ACB6RGB4_9PLEO|nr:uncharacterized protein BDR25DRAFT_251022 [Lindgomyces ingoldianus]KAF2478284.1 hypothetical protein BDR25DRAFT_251022 [Lindgomyces ingoldianus]
MWSLRSCRAFPLLWLLVRIAFADTDAPCYSPNGARATGYFACDPTAYITSCCPQGWTCYSNSMCVVTDPSTANSSHPIGTSMRGTCTNPVWNNAICGDYCLKGSDVDGSLKACGDNKFCCAHDQSCDCTNGAFSINPGIVQTIIGIVGLEHTQTSTISVGASKTASVTGSGFSTVRTASTGNQTPTKTAEPGMKKAADNRGRNAGIAIGTLLGLALLGLAGWFIYKKFFSGNTWDVHRKTEVPQTSEPLRPAPEADPYIRDNATNPQINLPVRDQSQGNFDGGNAPYGNDYERNAPSRGPLVASTTTIGTSTVNNGGRAASERPLSIVSDDEGEARYVRQRPSELWSDVR